MEERSIVNCYNLRALDILMTNLICCDPKATINVSQPLAEQPRKSMLNYMENNNKEQVQEKLIHTIKCIAKLRCVNGQLLMHSYG